MSTVLTITSDHPVQFPVGPDGTMITVLAGDTLYYADRPPCNAGSHQGLLTVGESVTVTDQPLFMRSASVTDVSLTQLPIPAASIYYQTVQTNSSSATQRHLLNLLAGSNVTITAEDNAGDDSTDVTIASSGGGGVEADAVALGNITGATTCDLSQGVCFTGTLTGNVTITFSNWPASPAVTEPLLILTQDGTGGRTITISGVTWVPNGSPPGFNLGASTINIIPLSSPDQGSHIYGNTGSPPTNEILHTVASSSTAQSLPDPSVPGNATVSKITLTANCTLTFPGNPASGTTTMTLLLVQDATGGRTVSWPTLKWAGKAGAPTLTAAAAGIDVFTFLNDGSGWYAFSSGLNMG